MIFSVQRFLEDHFSRRGLTDVDQYAIRVANTFDRVGTRAGQARIARELAKMRTVFYRRNNHLDRKAFEAEIAAKLHGKFQKKNTEPCVARFECAIGPARARLVQRRRSLRALLSEFKAAVEGRAVDAFWRSRRRHCLRAKPEKVAQGLLAVFAKGVIGSRGLVLREISCGIGFVDIGITFGSVLHLIELKILKRKVTGVCQLATYMRTEHRPHGWLVLFDTLRASCRKPMPAKIKTSAGLIHTLTVELNPQPPHEK